PRAHLDEIAVADVQTGRVALGKLGERRRCRGIERWRTTGLGALVEVMRDPAGREEEGKLVVRLLGRRQVLGPLDHGTALRIPGGVGLWCDRGAGSEVVSVGLAVVGRGVEDAVLV